MQTPEDLLKIGLWELGLSYTEKQIASFSTYLAELKKWNRTYNLTGLKTDRDIIVKHFLDSLLFLKGLPQGIHSAADIGAGAGFPGIPLKIMIPELQLFLIDPTRKKTLFLEHIRTSLGLSEATIINKRIEEVDGIEVDVAVTRALFSVREFLDKAGKILKRDGVFILSKGPKLEKELEGIDKKNVVIKDLKLPIENILRHLVIIRR
ncbi:MAG: 16S rRNA (guanine(527)-N(7))-methyltransferase RsmG [Nitrospirae bacterium]|nr:16S rRNA (guanine(527)-N(7))-methyltransferase RsmG [Nitrospirota bacterium]